MATEFEREYHILKDTKFRIQDALRNKGLEVGEEFGTYPQLIDSINIPSSVKFQGSRFRDEIPPLIVNYIKDAEGERYQDFAKVTFNNIILPDIANTNKVDLLGTFEQARFEETDPSPIYRNWFVNANSFSATLNSCEFTELDIDMAFMNYPNLVAMNGMFQNSMGIKSFDMQGTHAYKLGNLNYFLWGTEVEQVNLYNTMFTQEGYLMLQGMFTNCSNLRTVVLTDAFIGTQMFDWWAAFRGCTSLTQIHGVVNVNGYNQLYTNNPYALFSDEEYPILCQMTLDNLGSFSGSRPSEAIVDLSVLTGWGTNGFKQCVIDSLINNSADNSGYSPITIKLSENTKALLTEDELAQINAKGYIIE